MSPARFPQPFASGPPLIAVVHLPPSLGYPSCPGLAPALEVLRADLASLDGVDGILLENDNDKPHTLEVSKAQVAWLTRLATAAREQLALPLGIGVQRIDWRAALAVAAAAGLDFVRLDVFVDRVRMLDQEVVVDPAAVRRERAALGIEALALFTDIHVKHAEQLDDASLADSALLATREGSDGLLVTGARTGEPPTVDDLERARSVGGTPVLVGSGLTADNASVFAPHADGALVGTALKRGERIDRGRVQEVVEAWRSASRP